MAKKNKTMIIALGVLILLGVGYYGATIHSRNRADASFDQLPPAPTLGNLDSSEIVRIEGSGMVFEKQDERWELVSLNGEAPPDWIVPDQNILRSLSFVLATLRTERMAEEYPEDLSVYGLDTPSFRTILTDSHGNTAVYLLGDMTPFRTSYFVMEEGNPNVFVIDVFAALHVRFTLDDIRSRFLFPHLPLHALTRMQVETSETLIDISRMPEPRPRHLISTFSHFVMTSPYRLPRGVDNQALESLLTPLNNRRIEQFVNDFPSSLSPYGLDNPVGRFLLEFGEASIELLIGNSTGTARYAKLANASGVFTISGLEPFVNIRPFALMDKLVLLMGINEITQLSISGGERPLNAAFEGEGRDMVFFLNGRRADERSFRALFQNVIILSADAEIPDGNFSPASPENITIEYHLKNGERVSITFFPFNRDFYALSQEGTIEFLVARSQIRRMFQSADMVDYYD